MKKKPVFFIVLLVAILMVYTALFGITIPMGDKPLEIKGAPDMRFGIDIRGGVEAAFQPEGLDRKPTGDELESARTIIETRLDQQNIMDRDVTIDKENGYIIVRFPWKAEEKDFNPEEAIAELGKTAQLTFQDAEGNVLLDGSHVLKAAPDVDQSANSYIVSLSFDEEGAKLFADATEKLIGKTINIYMDKELIQSATVQAHITGGEAQITNMDSHEQAADIANKINAGALPFSMITKNYSTISPSLGSGALNVMVMAGLIAFAIICVILLFYYRACGVVACIALSIQVAGQILALSVPQMTLTLNGIAGIILSIGMGVDANVIAAERISEEIKSGKSVESAIKAGFANSFASVFDGNVTVLIVAFILMAMGTGTLSSFAYSLFTGIVFNFIAGISASRLMMGSLSSYKFLRKPKLYSCFSRRVTL